VQGRQSAFNSQTGGPGPCIYIPQEQGDTVISPGTGFPFCCLLRDAELRWRYSNPPPHRGPNQEDQVFVFMSPSDRVAQLYPQALGSLFVAFYDTQGYGGGILNRLHKGAPTRRTRFLYLCPPVTGWPSYIPRHRVPFSLLSTTRRAAVEVF
jgi:hypothetical protein